jgi:hypothetical protein
MPYAKNFAIKVIIITNTTMCISNAINAVKQPV